MSKYFHFLDQLNTFLIIVETGSFSAAAKEIGLTQPAVSIQIRHLEECMGVLLFQQVGRKMVVTAAGKNLIQHSREILELVERTQDVVRSSLFKVNAEVRLGISVPGYLNILPSVIRSIRDRYARVQVIVNSGSREECFSKMENGSLDLIIAMSPTERSNLRTESLLNFSFVAIGPKSGALMNPEIQASDLRGFALVLPDQGSTTRASIDAWLEKENVETTSAIEFPDIDTIKAMVAEGLGYSLVPSFSISEDDRQSLQIRKLKPPLNQNICLITRKNEKSREAIRLLVSAITKEINLDRNIFD